MWGHIAPRPPMLNIRRERAVSLITARARRSCFRGGRSPRERAELGSHQVTGKNTDIHSPHEHE